MDTFNYLLYAFILIYEGNIVGLKRFKDDAKEVKRGENRFIIVFYRNENRGISEIARHLRI